MDREHYSIVLASGSPRRRDIMEQIGVKFKVMASEKEENTRNIDPHELVRELSEVKASDVADRAGDMSVIIGADTVVAFEGRVLGKPSGAEDAFNMLKKLQNDTHTVHTGVCIIIKDSKGRRKLSFDVTTRVTVAPMTDGQIHAYIATGEPMDKAGAYAVQGRFAPFVSSIEGDYYNIVGFPVATIYDRLLAEGIDLLDNQPDCRRFQ